VELAVAVITHPAALSSVAHRGQAGSIGLNWWRPS
jgi:hypothetical protein